MLAAPLGAGSARADEPVRAAVGKPLIAAQALAHRGEYKAAMAKIAAAEDVRDKTANENLLIAQMRASVAQQSGDYNGAIAADEDLLRTGQLGAAQQQNLLMAEASAAYQLHDYARVENAVERYEKAGGRAPEMRSLLIQSAFLSKDYKQAGVLQAQQIAAVLHAGKVPSEADLQLLANCEIQTGDQNGLGHTMTQLVRFFPKPDYWAQLLHGLRANPNVPGRLQLDIDRLRLAVGLLTSTEDYMTMAELAVQAGLPALGLSVMNQGYASGALGKDAGAPREARLVNFVRQTIAQKKASLPADTAAARQLPSGDELVADGYSMVDLGQGAQGIDVMKAGIAKGGLTSVDEAKLHLGLAYMMMGDKDEALRTLATVGGDGPSAELASLWTLHLGKTA